MLQQIFQKKYAGWNFHKNWGQILICLLLVIGIFFRFFNLDHKIYWEDETYSSLRIAGYTAPMVMEEVYDGQVLGIEDLQKYQKLNPDKTIDDTIKALAGNPEHSPLYYLMARVLVDWFGSSIALMRGLAAFISLFTFPAIYWLCLELFESSLIAWVAIALIAISPFHVLYAQEARQYSLFAFTILLSSASLLRALRVKTKLSWLIYSVTVALGIYSHLLFTLVAIAHGIYLGVTEKFRMSQNLTNYVIASLLGGLAFCPWLLVVIPNYEKIDRATSWTSQKVSLFSWTASLAGNLSRLFIDFNIGSDAPLISLLPMMIAILSIIILIGYSLYFLISHTPQRVWLPIVLLIGVTALFLITPDIIKGGQRSTVPRYLIPCYLGIELSMSYLLGVKINSISRKSWQQKIWPSLAIAIFSAGVISCAISSQAQVWWNKGSQVSLEMVEKINQADRPLVISDEAVGSILSLSYLVDPDVQFQLVVKPNIPTIAENSENVFLFSRSKYLRKGLSNDKKYKVKLINQLSASDREKLWYVKKQ